MISSQMVRVESLNNKPREDAHLAFCGLKQEAPFTPLGENGRIIVAKRTLYRTGYEPIEVCTASVHDLFLNPKGEIKDVLVRAHFTLANEGAVDASLPECCFTVSGKRRFGKRGRDGLTVAYITQFAPELSLPLYNWLLEVKAAGRFINTPKFSFPRPS